MANTLVQIVQVHKVIKKQTLVENINMDIEEGRVVALCGGNGAGKSTILRMIAGILQPTSGEISVNGLTWRKDRKPYSEQIGYMPDDYQFQQGLTAAEALSFWAALRNVSTERVDEVLSIVGLENKRNKLVTTFSKGMRQRLLFAQAILANPSVLLMDEPTNGLDPFWMEELTKLIHDIKGKGQTILFTTHQLEIAEKAADDVVFLNEGRIFGEGTVDSFRVQYGTHPLYEAFQQSLNRKDFEGE